MRKGSRQEVIGSRNEIDPSVSLRVRD